MKQFELYRGAHAQGGVTSPAVVEDFQIVEDGVEKSDAWCQRFRLSGSVYILPQNDSMTALMQQSPIDPIEGTSPDRLARWTMTPGWGSRLAMAILRALVTTAAVWLVSMDQFRLYPGALKA